MARSTSPDKDPDADLLASFGAGETIFVQGESGDHMYIVERGQVELVLRFGPHERPLTVLGAGDFFGEMSVLEELPRTATARAVTDCRLLAIDPVTFDHLLRQYPEVTVRMLRKLSRSLREIDEENQRVQEVAAGVFAAASGDLLEPIKPGAVVPKQPGAPAPKPPGPRRGSKAGKPRRSKAASESSAAVAQRNPQAFSTLPLSPAGDRKSAAAASKPSSASGVLAIPDAVLPEPVPEPAAETAARLLHLKSGVSFPIAPGRKRLIGRCDPVTGKHPEIDLEEVGARTVSRRHARIWSSDGKFFVREEVGVANGTYLRGKRLGAGEDHEIFDGDRLKLGGVELVFVVGAGS